MLLKNYFSELDRYSLIAVFILTVCKGYGQNQWVTTTPENGSFTLADAKGTAPLITDIKEFEGVKIAVTNFKEDLKRVTAQEAVISNTPTENGNVIIGTLGKNTYIEELVKAGKLDVDAIKGNWEAFSIQEVDGNLIVVGSDKRGTIYGVYTLSEQIGVSPWYWWADVPVKKSIALYISASGYTNPGPKVQYRGIFINDEAPALSGWVEENFGSFNHEFYEHVFELILRLKGNYLWPAMWGRAFYDDDPQNPIEAEKYGVVIGTSHHEPLMRAHAEWDKYGEGDWNYITNSNTLQDFWKKGMQRMGNKESIVTVGMRGDGDEPMTEGTAIELLERIVKEQREIIEEVTQKPAKETPQVWALYKEVQDYYDQGMRVPEDITLLLADDNWGNIRKLPDPNAPERSGGYGIYYHFDYVGGPRNYKWLNTNQISKVYEQMSLAYSYNARKIWIVNVGDIKPMEYPTSFFMDYAWNPEAFDLNDLKNYPEKWASDNFGTEYASEIAALLQDYSTLASRRKPELLSSNTYSLVNYSEAEGILKEYTDLENRALSLKDKLDSSYHSAYFQLVLFPVQATANLNSMYIAAAKNALYAKQGRASTNEYAQKVQELFLRDKALTECYHTMNDSKWNHFMSQTHIGYTSWQEPRENKIPETQIITVPNTNTTGATTAGTADYFPAADTLKIKTFDRFHDVQEITLFNRGNKKGSYKIKKLPEWLSASSMGGVIEESLTIQLQVKEEFENKMLKNETLIIESGKDQIPFKVIWAAYPEEASGFLGYEGLMAIPATGFTENTGWEQIPDLGRQETAIRPQLRFSTEITTQNTQLSYNFTLPEAWEGSLIVYTSPTQDFLNTGGLKFGYALDGGEMETLNLQKDTPDNWYSAVGNNITRVVTPVRLEAGKHELKIYGIDPGIVLQHLVIKDSTHEHPTYLIPHSLQVE